MFADGIPLFNSSIKGDVHQFTTPPKCLVTDAGYTIRYRDARKACATRERFLFDTRNTIRDRNASQTSTSPERPKTDAIDTFRNCNTSNIFIILK